MQLIIVYDRYDCIVGTNLPELLKMAQAVGFTAAQVVCPKISPRAVDVFNTYTELERKIST